jgi:uncharacterized protein YjbI with pentapeptide repeats
MQIEIKSLEGNILHTIEANSMKAAVEALVKRGADLCGADLCDAELCQANLRQANLCGAKYNDKITLTKNPIFITGLWWPVMILDQHMKIGCELHSFTEWAKFKDSRISKMDIVAREWWRIHKGPLLAWIAAVRPVEGANP